MKTRLFIVLTFVVSFGLIPQAFADDEFDMICNHPFCIVGTNSPNLPITNKDIFILDIITNAGQSLDVKITNWSDEIVYSEYLNSNDVGIVSIRWDIPDEYYFGTFKVVISEKDNENPYGFTFRVGSDPYHLPPLRSHIVVKESTGTFLAFEDKNVYEKNETLIITTSNIEGESDPPPYLPFKILVHDQEDNLITATQLKANDKGQFEYHFTPTENGLYKIELIANYYDVWSGEYVDFTETRYIPVALKEEEFFVFVEDEKFPITFDKEYFLTHTIIAVIFNQEDKHLSVEFEEIQPKPDFDVIIPHKLLNGNYTVFLNDRLLDPNVDPNDSQHVHISKWEGFTRIDINTDGVGIYKLDVYGTSTIPEFGMYAIIILVLSIVPIILAKNKLILR